MRKYLTFIILLNFISCKAQKDINVNKNNINLIFEHSFIIDSNAEKSLVEMQNKIKAEVLNLNETDTTELEIIDNKSIVDLLKETPKTKIYIEFKNDSIWRYTTEKDIIIGDIFSLTKNNGNLDYRPKFEREKIYKTYDLFANKDKYIIEINKNKTKKILNYICYYVKLTRIENDNSEFSSGNTIYEMFVTKSIKLPVHSIIDISKKITEFFPLEIKVWQEKLIGAYEFYSASEIK
ncbi:hypothetical protein IQ05_00159 [Flavobacterium tiangeerense]|uniref:Uncharacterized protein n=1 Tax=Flavobacterium tiangeerense TaxID=459471 RepID=A0ABY3FNT6_9FLAO|nr:hypothetical protein [Flavobacterium tiangeerense]TWI03229.1 hypothetical protein IQ05_00159 [Flavobacterium tiangeerense]